MFQPSGAAMLSLTAADFFEKTTDCVIVLDQEWRFVFSNQSAIRELGVGGLVGCSLWESFPHAVGSIFDERYRLAIANQASETFESFYAPLDTWYEVHAVPAGSHLTVFFRNITEQRRALEAAESRRRALDALFSQAFIGIVQFSGDDELILANDHFCRIVGRSEEELASLPLEDWIHPEDVPVYRQICRAHRPGSEPKATELRFLRPDGAARCCSINLSFARHTSELPSTIIVAEDITDQLENEGLVRRINERYRLAVRATNDAVWDWDLVTGEVIWNEAIDQLAGTVPGSCIEWWKEHIHEQDRPAVVADLYRFVDHGKDRWQSEYRFRRFDGSYAQILDRGYVLRDDEGTAVRMIGAMSDLSERVEAQRQVNELQNDLIHVTRLSAMGTMASALAHEINQPLTGISNYLAGARRILRERGAEGLGDVSAAIDEAILASERVGEIIRRLRRMVSRGKAQLQPVPLASLVKDALALAIPNKALAGIKIDCDLSELEVLADPVQIQQVLFNLFRNAAEAMDGQEERRLRVTAGQRGETIFVQVADNGPGFADEVRENLFTSFRSTKAEGLGVGLTICRTIVEAHGGRIALERSDDAETIVSFQLSAPGI
jgi:two-component system sensor kinase FixL